MPKMIKMIMIGKVFLKKLRGMWWLNDSAPDCKTCSPGFKSGISPTCSDMSFLAGEPEGLA